jgi:hypothetical protein
MAAGGGYGSGFVGGLCGVLLALLAIFVGFTAERLIFGGPQQAEAHGSQH